MGLAGISGSHRLGRLIEVPGLDWGGFLEGKTQFAGDRTILHVALILLLVTSMQIAVVSVWGCAGVFVFLEMLHGESQNELHLEKSSIVAVKASSGFAGTTSAFISLE